MKPRIALFLVLLLGALIVARPLPAQEVFSGGDSGSDENFSAGDNGGPSESFNSNDDGGGPDNFSDGARYRPLPGYTNCGPWYNNYNNFVRAMMQHYGGMCQVRNGNQVWCHGRFPGNCNPDATGGRPDSPVVDTGVRYTPTCQSVCDRTVGKPRPQPVPVPMPEPKLRMPVDINLDNLPPCTDPPSLDQLAQDPIGGEKAVAYAMDPGGNVAVAIAMEIPSEKRLTGGVSAAGMFVPEQPPVTLRGKANINGYPVGSTHRKFSKKSLRVPATTKSKRRMKTKRPQNRDALLHKILTGGTHHYTEAEGRYRYLSGFLQGMADEMGQQAREGEAEKTKKENEDLRKYEGQHHEMCQIRANSTPAFEDAVAKPHEDPAGAGKFVTDMLDKIFENNKDLEDKFPKIKTSLKFLGPLLEGAGLVKNFKETYEVMAARDERIKDILKRDGAIDPAQLGWYAGQDAADTYALTVRSLFSLGVQ